MYNPTEEDKLNRCYRHHRADAYSSGVALAAIALAVVAPLALLARSIILSLLRMLVKAILFKVIVLSAVRTVRNEFPLMVSIRLR